MDSYYLHPRLQRALLVLMLAVVMSAELTAQMPSRFPAQSTMSPQTDPWQLPAMGIGSFDSDAGRPTTVFAASPIASAPIRVRSRFLMNQNSATGVLQVEVHMRPGFHVGSLTQMPGGPLPTMIHLQPSSAYQLTGAFLPNVAPLVVPADLFPVAEEYHEGVVVWSAPIVVAAGVDANALLIHGHLSGQACEKGGACRPLSQNLTAFTARFEAVAPPNHQALNPSALNPFATSAPARVAQVNAMAPVDLSSPLLQPRPYATAPPAALPVPSTTGIPPASVPQLGFFASIQSVFNSGLNALPPWMKNSVLAFLAGFILNFMPCVLPVIGLKVMSFVKQAGESRGRILTLNVAFVLGLMSVFMALACLVAFFGYSWGGLAGLPAFSVAMISIVFVLALSMLGVWEIPSPSFFGSGKAVEMSEKEGVSGAYFKGVLTTLLATPCTGPFLGAALAWALKQPSYVVFGTFFFMGLGMGFPYIVFALSPKLMSLLPKPGAWMDTFKEVMGFVLLATVVFLFTTMGDSYVIPTIALIFTLWAACWWIGRIPFTASQSAKLTALLSAVVFASVVGYFSFTSLYEAPTLANTTPHEGEWPLYTDRADLDAFRDKSIPVFVDFTADW